MVIFDVTYGYVMLDNLSASNYSGFGCVFRWAWLGLELGFHDYAWVKCIYELNVVIWIKLGDLWCWMY